MSRIKGWKKIYEDGWESIDGIYVAVTPSFDMYNLYVVSISKKSKKILSKPFAYKTEARKFARDYMLKHPKK